MRRNDAPQREDHAGGAWHFHVSRRRFLELGVAWMAAFAAAACGGEEDDNGEEDED